MSSKSITRKKIYFIKKFLTPISSFSSRITWLLRQPFFCFTKEINNPKCLQKLKIQILGSGGKW